LLFLFDERGLQGLLTNTQAVTIAARGAELGGMGEHQISYMATWCKMVGIKAHHDIVVEKTLYGPDVDKHSREGAVMVAEALAKKITL